MTDAKRLKKAHKRSKLTGESLRAFARRVERGGFEDAPVSAAKRWLDAKYPARVTP